MADAVDPYDFSAVVDLVENTLDAHSDSPIMRAAEQFAAAARTRVAGELLDRANNTGTKKR